MSCELNVAGRGGCNSVSSGVGLFTSPTAIEHGIHYIQSETKEVARYRDRDDKTKPLFVYGNPRHPDFLKSSYCFTYLPYPDPSSLQAWKNAPGDNNTGARIWVTHSPPKDRLDAIPVLPLTGCEVLARRVAKARPLLIVFGHYHSSYGVEQVKWKKDVDEVASSKILSDPASGTTEFDFSGSSDTSMLAPREDTLFVNAAWMTMKKKQIEERNMPWLFKLNLEGASKD